MGYFIWDIEPTLFKEVDFLRWYGLCWMFGMLLGYRLLKIIFTEEGQSLEALDRLVMYMMVGAVVGARLGHVFFYDPWYYLQHPVEILPIQIEPSFRFTGLAGLASHGGVLAAFVALWLYRRRYAYPYLWLLDRLSIAGAALGGFIRVGNFMNAEIVGRASTVPWAVVFKKVDMLPRHPTQLYEAGFYFLVSLLLYKLWQRKTYHHGFIAGTAMVLIFIQRFLMEFLKENQVPFEDQLLLNMGQILSIPLVGIGAFLMIRSYKQQKDAKGGVEKVVQRGATT